MKVLLTTQRVIHRFTYGVCAVGMFLAIPLMLITTCDVISRSFLNKPIPGTFELSEYMLAVLILLAAAYTHQVKGHVGVDFLTSKLPPGGRKICEILTGAAALFIVGILTVYGFSEGIHETAVSDQLRVPQWPFKVLVGVGGLMLWAEICIDLLVSLAGAERGE